MEGGPGRGDPPGEPVEHSSLSAWFNLRAFPAPEGLAVYFRDVSAEHEAQEKLVEQASLLDQARDAIIVRTLDGRITYCNRGAEHLYRVETLDELTGAVTAELEYGPTLPAAVKDEVVDRGEWIGEVEHQCADGATITVQSHLTLVRDRHGRPSRILAINTDITEQKKLQAVVLRTQRLESSAPSPEGSRTTSTMCSRPSSWRPRC